MSKHDPCFQDEDEDDRQSCIFSFHRIRTLDAAYKAQGFPSRADSE